MDNLDFPPDSFYLYSDVPDSRSTNFRSLQPYLPPHGWPLNEEDFELDMSQRAMHTSDHQDSEAYSSGQQGRQTLTATSAPLNATALGLALAHTMHDPTALLQSGWQYTYDPASQQTYSHHTTPNNSYEPARFNGPLNGPLQSSPVEFMPTTTNEMQLPMHVSNATLPVSQYMTMPGPMDSMSALAYPLHDYTADLMSFPMAMAAGGLNVQTAGLTGIHSVLPGSSPSSATLEVCSLSSSDNGWAAVNFTHARSLESYNDQGNAVFNPGETLHIRTESNSSSDISQTEQLSGPYEEMAFPMYSPASDSHGFEFVNHNGYSNPQPLTRQSSDHGHDCAVHSPNDSSSSPVSDNAGLVSIRPVSASSSSSSPTSSSPPLRRRKSPTGPPPIAKTTKATIKKSTPNTISKALVGSDKKVGRRRGPLRPDQRQQAHEIRKLRACLRCKFLKKTCDKGDPCTGCRPSHARLWQVPCTRIDIKDINYFMKDWRSDYQRHISLGFSVNNIKGFSNHERMIYITHGYGHYLPLKAREVFVVDEKCFASDWVETMTMTEYEHNTAKLSAGAGGVSTALLNEYIDCHLDNGNFDSFVDSYFDGTPFLTDILHTAYKYYQRTQTPVLRKALRLVVAYSLTQNITMVEGLSEEESTTGRIDEDAGRWAGKIVAPVMINFQVKCALADMWRELQKDVLEELSSLYSAVYQGERLRKWPTIFMLATILLAIWELMQFDSHYREPDAAKVEKFCSDMESTPVGVVVGLFQAISQKLPSFMEWDTSKHSTLLHEDEPICDALTEVREHVLSHEHYLRGRAEAKYDRNDFDSLSNKFLSRLVIRAN